MTMHSGKTKGVTTRTAGIIGIVVISVLVYFAFTKNIPFTQGYQVSAYFNNAANIQPKAAVRIAGVNIGKVSKVEKPGQNGQTKVVMELDKDALPIHANAAAKIRFRIFLEGNPFVDLSPGTPGSPELKSGSTIPVTQTAGPVQLDQLLSAVNSDARKGLENLFTEIGTALNTKGTPEENATQDPDVRDLTGAEALNRAFRYGPDGFRGGAKLFDALNGYSDADNQTILKGLRDFNEAINERETQLVPLIGNFATTIGAFADDEVALAESTKQFSRLAYESLPTLRQLNVLLPELTEWSNTIAPQLKEIPATSRAAYPWIEQNIALFDDDELGTTAKLAQETTKGFAQVQSKTRPLLNELNNVSLCWNNVWWPTLNTKLNDGSNSSGKENYKEFWYSLVGWNSSSQNLTSTGPYLRLGAGSNGSGQPNVKTPSGVLYGNAPLDENGKSPLLPGKNPTIQTKTACYKNAKPNLAPTKGSVTP